MRIKRIKIQFVLLASLATIVFMSCQKGEPTVSQAKGDLAVMSMITDATGMSGTSWLQLVEGISPKTVDNSKAYQVGFGMQPVIWKNNIFMFPDYGQSNTLVKWTRSTDGVLSKTGEIELPISSFSTHGNIISDNKGYLATMTGKILILDPSAMKLTGEIDVSAYANPGVVVPMPASMLLDGDLLYVPLWQVDAKRQPAGEPLIDMIIIDVKTDKVIKRFGENKSGLTNPGYPYGIQKNCFKDEQGDIYFIAGGNFSMNPKYKTGILRIKKGTQEIDPDYNWVLNDQAIEGEKGKTRWLGTVHYAGNGKLYGMADIPDYWANPAYPNYTRDRGYIAVEIDIYAKTIKKLPVPKSCGYAVNVAPYNDLFLFAVWGEKDSGFYTYDPKTGKVSDEAVIKMPGFAFWCYQFK